MRADRTVVRLRAETGAAGGPGDNEFAAETRAMEAAWGERWAEIGYPLDPDATGAADQPDRIRPDLTRAGPPAAPPRPDPPTANCLR